MSATLRAKSNAMCAACYDRLMGRSVQTSAEKLDGLKLKIGIRSTSAETVKCGCPGDRDDSRLDNSYTDRSTRGIVGPSNTRAAQGAILHNINAVDTRD